jgi:hypothetical protein
MPTKLPKHTENKYGDTIVLTFAEPLTADAATLAHRHLAAAHPGASIATTGDRQVQVTVVTRSASRPASRRK